MEKPLVSICIPTYNRCSYLKNSLNSIICQKEFQDGKVEIVISDNVSTDGTQTMAEDYAAHYQNIHYFRNSENLVVQNFPLALSRGRGQYRKLSNDTFLYLPGSLSYLCRLVQENRETEEVLFFLDKRRVKGEIIKCNSLEQFVCTTGVWTTWSGAFGLWENECERITKDLSGCDLLLWHCMRIYEMVEAKGGAQVVNRRLFIVQEVEGKNVSYGLYQVLHLNFLSILKKYVDKGLLSQETNEKMRKESLYRFIFFFNRAKLGTMQWNLPDGERIRELVLGEAKQMGCLDDYQKQLEKKNIFVPLRTYIKIIFQNVYSAYLSVRFRVGKTKQQP